jgi:hypothetical protein
VRRRTTVVALAVAAVACTLRVDVPVPNVTVKCVEIVLPGGWSSTACPDSGADAGEDSIDREG